MINLPPAKSDADLEQTIRRSQRRLRFRRSMMLRWVFLPCFMFCLKLGDGVLGFTLDAKRQALRPRFLF